jgi:hypothetical protein
VSILAIDPGTEQSGWCLYGRGKVHGSGVLPNKNVLASLMLGIDMVPGLFADVLAIEMVASYGMPVGREVFETVRWIGRFQQAWHRPEEVRLVYRKDVKIFLCGTMKAKDPHIWQALQDKIGEVGTKKNPGPLYNVKSHARSALAVAVTAEANIVLQEKG